MLFDRLIESLIQKFKPTGSETVAILPGGFKPPHKGHFNALNYILEEADRGIVFIGKGVRDNITAEQSKQIWEIYKKYLNKPVEIIISDRTPVVSTYEYADNNKDINIIVGAGPEDEKRFNYFKNNLDKYPLVKIINIPPMHNRISGTAIRQKIIQKDPDIINVLVPTQSTGGRELNLLTPEDKEKIKNIISS